MTVYSSAAPQAVGGSVQGMNPALESVRDMVLARLLCDGSMGAYSCASLLMALSPSELAILARQEAV